MPEDSYFVMGDNRNFSYDARYWENTYVTRMAEDGMDLKSLQTIMGHASIEVTMNIYNHASLERNQKEMERLDEKRS